MKTNILNQTIARATQLMLITCLLWTSASAQFISRGMASLNRINPSARIQPITLLPDGNTITSGYGIGNISSVSGTGGNSHIGIVKGDLVTGLIWDKIYLAENTIEAVKSLIFEKELYVLFNVLDETNTISYSGIFAVDKSTGNITKVQCFGKSDGYLFKAKDFTVCNGQLIVVGEKYFSLWANDYAAQILVIDPSGLNVIGSTAVLYNNEGYLSPEQVVAIKDQFVVTFLGREGYISYNDQIVVAKFRYDNTTSSFITYAEAAYVCPNILSHANIAYNPYNNTLPLVFQEFANYDGAGTLNLFILDPATLDPINTNSYKYTRRMYKSNINIDSKFISLSAANNTADNQVNPYGSAQTLFDHSGDFIQTITNPYQRNAGLSIGWDFQRNYMDGSTSLFVIENTASLNWVYGYGANKECNLKEDNLVKFDNFIFRSKGVKTKYNSYENVDFKLQENKAGFYIKIECGKRRFGKEAVANNMVEEYSSEDFKILKEENTLTLKSENTIGQYKLTDGLGRVIKQGTADNNTLNIETYNYTSGLYFLNFESNGKLITKKIIL
jgi:hypothetical protein